MSTGAQLRDHGIAQVLKHHDNWAMVSTLKFSFWLEHIAPIEFCIEDFRTYAESTGMRMTNPPNAWGAISKGFKKLIRTVGYTHSQRPSAHARLPRTYQRA